MEAADLLCDSLFHWLDNRKECADKLLEMAQELENVHLGSNIAQGIGAAAYVASIISTASVAGFLTGGLALPLLAVAAAVGTLGAAVSIASPLVEAGISRKTIKRVNKLIKEDEEVGRRIQKQLQDLKDRCGGAKLGDHAEELDCEVTSQLMCALARRNNTHVPLDFLRAFNRATFYRHLTPGGLAPAEAESFICQALDLDRVPVIKSSLKVLDAIGSDRSLNNLIVTCKELVKRKQISEASKFLRDSARDILKGQQELQEQLDAMLEIIQKLFQMKNLINDLGEYSLSLTEDEQKIVYHIMGTCTDNRVVSWLQGVTHQTEFVNLLRFVLENFGSITENLIEPGRGDIHIVIVAHGSIVDQFMPAGFLVPTDNIKDTILYSPWNCSIDSSAAFGIAQGNIDLTNRQFYNLNPEANNMVYYEPNPLPDRWNSMRESLHNIPGILLSPVTPEERAWAFFHQLWTDRSMEIEDRIIIPYHVPQNGVNAFRQIPLYMLIFVISFVLKFYGKTATVHLAACLDHAGSPPMSDEWRTQYAFTSDGTHMTVNMDDRNMNPMLFRALRSLFDRQEP
ncbi:hypothetical protein ABG768_006980 [Culter alburnus]|uniref:Uncharacterized protein n=1 Tax=Culter alburnus TaxID=194366 RepID=A0AAW1ZT60_CULAL